MKNLSKIVVSLLIIVSSTAFFYHNHKTMAYSWIGEEVLTSSTTKFNMWLKISPYGENQQLLNVVVDTEKFYFRAGDETSCIFYKVEIYQLRQDQTFKDVAGNFSNGGCELYDTVKCDNKCVPLERGKYIFKFITQSKGEQFENFLTVFGPPVPVQ